MCSSDLSAYSENRTVGINLTLQWEFVLSWRLANASQTIKTIKTFTFELQCELHLNSFSLLNRYAFVFSLVVIVFSVTMFYLLSALFSFLSSVGV